MASRKTERRFGADGIRRFLLAVLRRARVRGDVARLLCEGLVSTSIRGVDSHGIRLFPHYLAGVENGRINPDPAYRFERTAPAAGRFDADHTFGHAAGIEAMRRAMKLADKSGVGMVSVYNSSHNGAQAYFALEAARRGYIGFAFTHADSLINSTGSTRAFFGTNPTCMAVPCRGEEPFCYDSAPSFVTWNRVRQYAADGESAPAGYLADAGGDMTTDPRAASQLIPIGGYKGFGLAMVVDILCGLLSGMPAGRDISSMFKTSLTRKRYLGQFYAAVRIDAFQSPARFKSRMKQMMDAVRREPRKDPKVPVMVPGDPQKLAAAERRRTGIPVQPHDLELFGALALTYRVPLFAEQAPVLRRPQGARP